MGGKVYNSLLDAYEAGFEQGADDECWLWQKNVDKYHLYGRLAWNKQLLLPHRVTYQMFLGPIPDGMVVRHKCDRPGCVNPSHLELGSKGDNTRDAFARGQLVSKGGTLQRGPNAAHPPRRA